MGLKPNLNTHCNPYNNKMESLEYVSHKKTEFWGLCWKTKFLHAWTLIIKSLRWYLHLWWTSWKWTLRILWLFDYLWLSLMFFLSFLLSSINWLTSPAEIISIMTRTTHSWLLLMPPSPPSSSILMFLPSIISIFPLLHHFEFNSFFIFQCRKTLCLWWNFVEYLVINLQF